MANSKPLVLIRFAFLVGAVVGLSLLSNRLWPQQAETIPPPAELVVAESMTVARFGQANDLDSSLLKEILDLTGPEDLDRPLADFGLSPEQLQDRVDKARALAAEHASKNWRKILVKFGLWLVFLSAVLVLVRRNRVTPRLRKLLYLTAVLVFGVVLGSDPSPMGTIKDAIHLLAAEGVIFPPRLIALAVFLLMVFAANKFICAWGCQLGTLQDLIFRLNRNAKDAKGLLPQFKPPFALANTVRVLFLAAFTAVAVLWAADVIEPVDPFKVYKPLALMWYGLGFVAALLVAGLFVYRPWCHFFCPFGLAGWLVEKIAFNRIKVDYATCIACEACAKACPSTVMNAILRRDTKVIPDCFACATCMGVCPTNSISFGPGKRSRPPAGHFEKNSA